MYINTPGYFNPHGSSKSALHQVSEVAGMFALKKKNQSAQSRSHQFAYENNRMMENMFGTVNGFLMSSNMPQAYLNWQ